MASKLLAYQMKLFCISDIHTEFDNSPVIPECDVVVLAGDIGSIKKKTKLFDYLKYTSRRVTHVIYVLGNHEFYGGALHTTADKIRDAISTMNLTNLDNASLIVGKVEFFGTTLW